MLTSSTVEFTECLLTKRIIMILQLKREGAKSVRNLYILRQNFQLDSFSFFLINLVFNKIGYQFATLPNILELRFLDFIIPSFTHLRVKQL